MTTQETTQYITDKIMNYYSKREANGWSGAPEEMESFLRLLPEVKGLKEVFTPLRALDELDYNNEDGGRNMQEAAELHKKFSDAIAEYPEAAKIHNINTNTFYFIDEVSPKIKKIVETFH